VTEFFDRLLRDRNVRRGSIAGIPPLWFTVAWGDVRMVLLAVAAVAAAAYALRELERRRPPDDDEPLWL
jgi:hypothetical protein